MSRELVAAGNACFVDEDYEGALDNFSQAIEQDANNDEVHVLRAATYLKLNKFTDAVSDCNRAIALNPNNAKAYLRKGIAMFSLEEFAAAKTAFEKAKEFDPSNNSVKTYLRKCNAELESEAEAAPVAKKPATAAAVATTTTTTTTSSSSSSAITSAAAAAAQQQQNKKESRFRHEWFQSQSAVTVDVFIKGSNPENCKVSFEPDCVELERKLEGADVWQMTLDLFDKIIPAESSVNYLSTKVEIKLKKASASKWDALERLDHPIITEDEQDPSQVAQKRDTYPSSKGKKDWNKIANEMDDDKPEGDEALNKFFQELYSKSSEETRRAMNKSFLESGGTVLSTNWTEVGQKKVEGTPPDGLEMKKWTDLGK